VRRAGGSWLFSASLGDRVLGTDRRIQEHRMGMTIDIWSDVVCPWCYIGKRRLERALEDRADDVRIVWRSFELDPFAPTEPTGALAEGLAEKYGMSVEEARATMDGVA